MMLDKITNAEIQFLKHHGIDLDMIFDGFGKRKKIREDLAKQNEKQFIFIDSCTKGLNHRFTTRRGHCIQCDTSRISYQKRTKIDAFVYLAYSPRYKLIKIGLTEDKETRLNSINYEQVGGANDWEYLLYAKLPNAGEHELNIHALFAPYLKSDPYEKGGNAGQISREVFEVDLLKAKNIILTYFEAIKTTRELKVYESKILRYSS